MTSINLVSPVGNGHTYSVRFREPLVIEANSKVYLNFAKFKRNSSVYFTTDQTIEVILNEVLPTVLPSDTSVSNSVMALNSITIPTINPITGQTGYTAKELEKVISDRFSGDPDVDDDLGIRTVAGVPKQMFLYNSIYEEETKLNTSLGWYKDYDILGLSNVATLSTAHVLGMAAAGGDIAVKTSADSANVRYDAFAMSKQTYDFSYKSQLKSNSENHNLITFQQNMTVGTQVGNIFCGLTSHEIADSISGTDWTDYAVGTSKNSFTHGTTATQNSSSGRTLHVPIIYSPNVTDAIQTNETDSDVLQQAVPQAFLGIEITGSGGTVEANKKMLNVWRGINFETGIRTRPTKPSKELNRMELLWSTPLDTLLMGADADLTSIKIGIQTYWADGFSASSKDKLEFRVYNLTHSHYIDVSNLIYDSKSSVNWLKYEFFRQNVITDMTAGTDAQKAQKANSQIPFNVLMSSQVNGEGFETLELTGWEKIGANSPLGTASNASPITLVNSYQLKLSTEIARFLGVNTSDKYNPNQPEDEVSSITKVNPSNTDESYSIFLKNLPIRAYKNIQSKAMSAGANIQSAGYSQPIIHDVPAPYSDSKVINSGSGDILVGTFQPSILKKLDLDNNRMVLNSLDVEIRDIETNEISEGLSGSVINFTIEKPM